MNSTERAFYGSPFWAQKGTFFKCSDKNESFYLQKVCFSDRKNFPNLTTSVPHPKIGKTQHNALYESRWKTQHNALYESRWKTQHNALYESRWKTQHNALYESRWKTQHNALYESRCGVGTKFYRGFVVTPTDLY
ncbi:hypothetical protein LEP1GSC151_3128 [Leptospira interrogans serovar Grippotyphosa str. LT2186]|uniref:Uncharacterized protein n=1 Tax=Leptospira interrogans serovar Grippotyphosa str. LT2186 TaxID=1001599 RepID=M3GQY4_LEPIR|nr:hypothetical protein LEP1GSC151_3128 [Leptospira interrogans serovar Grippotyphosa str. LT2186]